MTNPIAIKPNTQPTAAEVRRCIRRPGAGGVEPW
jgi:hypothetical protein